MPSLVLTIKATPLSVESSVLTCVPLSHDEVVHLKCSMINKMPGEYDDKFENLKAGYSFMMGHPGKKLLFMGQEFGQFQEWSEARELDWYLLREARHQQLQDYVRDLQMMYKKYPALYADANGYDGFQWINADDADRSIKNGIALRKALAKEKIFVPTNWSNVIRDCAPESYEYQWAADILPLPCDQRYGNEEMQRIADVIHALEP